MPRLMLLMLRLTTNPAHFNSSMSEAPLGSANQRNLLREASLYRYDDERTDRRSETPVDEHNHALGALRSLVSMIDHRQMARMMSKGGMVETAADEAAKAKKQQENWLQHRNEALWARTF
jgi:hypothetical protein